ncbi:MAG: hypothetical protein PHS80_15485, partial [Methanothrix sp.]|nr:hypothetical protein [Methanothrix sp.]
KRTGFHYKTVDRGLNHMLKKDIVRRLREDRAYHGDLALDWNNVNQWKIEGEDIINSRKEHGKDWMKKSHWAWHECSDPTWKGWKAYVKEHQTFI